MYLQKHQNQFRPRNSSQKPSEGEISMQLKEMDLYMGISERGGVRTKKFMILGH